MNGQTGSPSTVQRRHAVLLGGQGMNPLPAALLPIMTVYLRVAFDNNDGQGLRHLKPDQRITSVPYAKVAERIKPGHHHRPLNEQILKYLKPRLPCATGP